MNRSMLMRYMLAVSMLLPLVSWLPGCGGTYSGKNGAVVAVEVSGTLSLRGSQPYPVLLLERDSGGEYLLRSANLLGELRNLKGMRVRLTGTTPERPAVTVPVLTVERYRLLPLPGGEQPVIGMVVATGESCLLQRDDGGQVAITGEFGPVLAGFRGAKVWVIGEAAGEDELRVTGYGVIAPSAPNQD